MIFESPYWEPKTKMEMLERWILVHSHLYYDLDSSVVSDNMFDTNCNQLYSMIQSNKREFRKTKYYKAFIEFDGSTGFGLVDKLQPDLKDLVMRDAANLKDGVIK